MASLRAFYFIFFFLLLHSCSSQKSYQILSKECSKGVGDSCQQVGDLEKKQDAHRMAELYWIKACELGNNKGCDRYIDSKVTKGDLKEALVFFKSTCEEKNPYSCTILGKLLDHYGKNKTSEKFYQMSCEKDDLGGCTFLAIAAENKGDNKLALKLYEKACNIAVDERPKDYAPIQCYYTGKLYARFHMIKEAVKYYELSCNSKSVDKGIDYKRLGCLKKAIYSKDEDLFFSWIEYFKRRCRLKYENSPSDCVTVSLAYSIKGDKDKSVSYFEEALKKGWKDWKYLEDEPEAALLRESEFYRDLRPSKDEKNI